MKFHNSIYVLFLCILCTVMGGCQEEIELSGTESSMEMMPFRLYTNMSMTSPNSRASIVGGGEQSIDDVTDMILLCFDANGLYLGQYSLSRLTPESSTGINVKGVIEGNVPISTCRIHFIANHEMDLSTVPLGMHENTLMLSEHMAVDRTQNLCYWGYKCTESTDEMKTWLNGQTPNTIYLVRDRARVQLASVSTTDGEGNPITGDEVITRIECIASHGLGKGYLAPFDRNKLDTNPFEDYISRTGNEIKYTASFTPYENANRYKLAAVTGDDPSTLEQVVDFKEEDMVLVYSNDGTPTYYSNYIYLFEDPNELPLADNDGRMPVKLILKVTYAGGDVRYHPVLIMDQSTYEQYRITRNYTYVIHINTLPKGLGRETFEKAVNSDTYSNNQLLEVDKVVTDVSNGTYMLRIKGTHGTSTLYVERDDDDKVRLDFEYKEMVGGNEQPVNVEPDNFTVRWLEVYDDLVTDIDPSRVEITYDKTTGCGQLIIPINEVTPYLRSGQLLLTDKKVGLARYIYIYAINYFDLDQTNVTLEQTIMTSGGKNVYKLTFTVPDEYPSGLYPLNFQFATRYLNAFATNYDGTNFITDAAFSVDVASTDPGKPENVGLESSTSTAAWNYDAAAWNYWYTYSLPAKRETQEGGEDENKHTVYLQDVTSSFSSISGLTTMGVFYRIKHFSKMDNGELKNVLSATCGR